MYYDFLRNVVLVLFLCGVVILIKLSVPKKYSPFLMGLMFGVITIGVMNDRIMIAEGHFFDFRHITMTLSGYIGGPIAALVAAVLSSLYRYYAGGSGSMGGIMNIIVFAGFGSILGRVFKDARNKRSLLFWFLIGLLMAVVLLTLIAFFTQANPNSVAFATVKYPFLLLTPLATMIIFNFYFWVYDFLGKAFVLNALLNDSPLNLMIFNQNHRITLSNYAQTQAKVSAIFSNPELFLGTDNLWMHSEQLRRREIQTEDGSYFVADLCRIEMPSGELACAAVVNDITSQKQDYECLQGAKDRFAKAFELGPHMMAIIRVRDYKYVDVNRRFLEIRNSAREDVIGKTPMEIGVPEGEFRKVIEILKKQGTVQNLECSLVTKSGAVCSAIVSADMIWIEDGLTCFFQDISSRKIAEEEMARLDRLNLVGQLAAGIGHEIRNPMTTVRGYLQLLGEKRDFASQKETFALMISELDRANSIITEFLSLARTRQTELQSQNLNDLIYNLYPLLEADSFIQHKTIRFIPGEIPNLNVNGKEISQVIINLIRNGLEAMPGKGCVTIKTYVENGDVVVSVQDEGTGIATDILNRIGTPFFTTKDTGTGLGLAICYKIIDSHNAKIQLETSPLGTTFSIIFPKSDENKSQRQMIA